MDRLGVSLSVGFLLALRSIFKNITIRGGVRIVSTALLTKKFAAGLPLRITFFLVVFRIRELDFFPVFVVVAFVVRCLLVLDFVPLDRFAFDHEPFPVEHRRDVSLQIKLASPFLWQRPFNQTHEFRFRKF